MLFMKGVILGGGNGTRLRPLTQIINKHLLPLYDKPVIFYAVEKLVEAGIEDIMIVVSPEHIKDFMDIVGDGKLFKTNKNKKVRIVYEIQKKPSGIANGLWIAKDFVGTDNVALHLGDNIIEDNISNEIKLLKGGAKIFLKSVKDPERFGIATLDSDGNVIEIIEKPSKPKTNYAVVGLYIYDNSVFDKIKKQTKSARGEYEITWINNKYIEEGGLKAGNINGAWFDVGTFDSLFEASYHIRTKNKRRFGNV